MKTAEKIIKENIPNGIVNVKGEGDGKPQYRAEIDIIIKCMQEYADQFKQPTLPEPAMEVDGWILVNDELPKKDGNSSIDCLTYDKYHNQIRVLSFNEHHHCWDDESGDDYYTDAVGGKVSHWMPLPTPPIKDKH